MPDNQAIVIQRPDTSDLPVVSFQTILALRVTDDKTCTQATEAVRMAKGYISAVKAKFEKVVALAFATHRSLTGMQNEFTAPAEAVEKHCRKEIEDYLARKKREELAMQAKLQREAEERAKAEAEAKRQAEIQAVQEAADDVAPWEQEEAQAKVAEIAAKPLVVETPQVVLCPVAPQVEGLGTRKGKPTYEVTDFAALVRAAAANPALLDYLQVNDAMVKAKLKTVGEKIGDFIPGITFKRDTNIVIR